MEIKNWKKEGKKGKFNSHKQKTVENKSAMK